MRRATSQPKPALDEDQLVADMASAGFGPTVSRQDVERLLSISRQQAYLLLWDGQLGAVKVGLRYRVSLRSIAHYLAMGVESGA